jgi:type IV pilus assembly protein PilV
MKKHQSGVVLLEALLAILILAIGLLGTIGLQARAYSALNDAGMRTEAAIAAEKLLGVMSNDQANLAAYASALGTVPTDPQLSTWYGDTAAAIPGAKVGIVVTPIASTTQTEIDITITWPSRQNKTTNQHVVTAYLAQAL